MLNAVRHAVATAVTPLVGTAGLAAVLICATPASAGGIGSFLSPAIGTECANPTTDGHAYGGAVLNDGPGSNNLTTMPFASALNQCGGADLVPNLQPGNDTILGAPIIGPMLDSYVRPFLKGPSHTTR
ncbi:hypothetical protein [Streptomyces sp. MST-110588]|uniref:hypothetical protein n=1 Tax=Streptomyces sp. MST-110588 TaxID=2833628 RepID=UPI001F5C6DBC|nr:hypothetical protein [Streptomyces sp. MST-110588]UNO39284.1 hypothetical protein KGS77_06190 [Streptomyces sp. MST-110588]